MSLISDVIIEEPEKEDLYEKTWLENSQTWSYAMMHIKKENDVRQLKYLGPPDPTKENYDTLVLMGKKDREEKLEPISELPVEECGVTNDVNSVIIPGEQPVLGCGDSCDVNNTGESDDYNFMTIYRDLKSLADEIYQKDFSLKKNIVSSFSQAERSPQGGNCESTDPQSSLESTHDVGTSISPLEGEHKDTPVEMDVTEREKTSSPQSLEAWIQDFHSDQTHSDSEKQPQNQNQNPNSMGNESKLSLLQFALLYFRNGEKYDMLRSEDGSIRGTLKVVESMKRKGRKHKDDWTWKEQVDMIKFSQSPIQNSLLKLETSQLNKVAVESFIAVMQYMRDFPLYKGQSEVDCVYFLLLNCHKFPALRDEVYCQIMKQTTNNKSDVPDSCQRGWRLFSVMAAYFTCSDLLEPYLLHYLETAAYDKRRAYHGSALICLENIKQTISYGGRKNVPSFEEVAAITVGRTSKRQLYRLPGGSELIINTKSTTVVIDIIREICRMINVFDEKEMDEFSLYCIVEGDTFTMPLAREEYVLDVTTELHKNYQHYYLIFFRSVWFHDLRLESQLYVEIVFSQIAPDYLEGLLLVMPGEQLEQKYIYDIGKFAALIHRAADMEHMPTIKDTKFLLPKPALTVRDIKPPQWVHMVQTGWKDIENLKPYEAKAKFLEILSSWDLFGSSFSVVKSVDPRGNSENLLALNKKGIHILDLITHETLKFFSFSSVICTRRIKSEDGSLYLDIKTGDEEHQKVSRFETDQANELSRLIKQYLSLGKIEEMPPAQNVLSDVTPSR